MTSVIGPVTIYGWRDRCQRPFIAIARSGPSRCVRGPEFRVTIGDYSVLDIDRHGFGFGRLWVEWMP